MEVLILILVVGLALGYFILHPIKSIKFTFIAIAVFLLGLIGTCLLFGIPLVLLQSL